jgi:2-succinyl-5-enolpyruvyl-6-hydroxy-3-cyclohexene-1-carboxylate synthase
MLKEAKKNINQLWSALIVHELCSQGATHFYCAPGLRNAPLLNAVKNNPQAVVTMGIDERSLGLRALGAAKASGIPAVLICTSGSALSHFFPAVIEAQKTEAPLFIISADRPPEVVFSGDNQTIFQGHFFQGYVQSFCDLGAPSTEVSPFQISTTIDQLIAKSERGVVHLNCPFRLPLDLTEKEICPQYIQQAFDILESSTPSTTYAKRNVVPCEKDIASIAEKISQSKRVLLVIGELPIQTDLAPLESLVQKLSTQTYIDVLGQIKYSQNCNNLLTPSFDHPEVGSYFGDFPPDLVLHLGGRVVSKHYYGFLEKLPLATPVINVHSKQQKEDPSSRVSMRLVMPVESVVEALLNHLSTKTDIKEIQNPFEEMIQSKRETILQRELSYPLLSIKTIEHLQEDSLLYLGNSTVIRCFDLYHNKDLAPLKNKNISILGNRGASGIEGLMSCSFGASDLLNKKTVLVVGDISFLHDQNALLWAKDFPGRLLIILVNNQGGGIFGLLPISENKELIPMLSTPHDINFSLISEYYSVNYQKAQTTSEFVSCFEAMQDQKGVSILEAKIDNELNKDLYNSLKTIKYS